MKTTNDTLAAAVRRGAARRSRGGFTLIELLVVISVMAILASFTLVVAKSLKRTEYIKVATTEMNLIESALDNYQKQYGSYPPSNPNVSPLVNTLYYELNGVTNNSGIYITLDHACQIKGSDYQSLFTAGGSSIGGILNCTKGGAEEGTAARNFLSGLRQNQIASTTNTFSNNQPLTSLITSVRGPDLNYQPLGVQDVNPFRYMYPGTNNPGSYDLWVQLVISGKTNLICNWSKTPLINSPLP